ncbi:MAG: acyltransferase [Bacteroidota bacterium]|uniref:Hexapeptide repeat of succinyl-transferase n=1 Tax=Algoriphagus faecimaris TaxID=686796 RepID=A0A1G6NR54_9BACT|nr:acyltransferase [Algoriphagus faecimaris]SDC69834.1 Hexapeptide repeat of succinyl-transferase [Algoriphagus faecimaris]
MISRFKNIISDKRKRQIKEGLPADGLTMSVLIFQGVLEVLLAKWYFRNAYSLGKMVSVKYKPFTEIYGKLILGDRVKLWSKFDTCKILVKKNATLSIGEDSFINGVHISASVGITIGKNVHIGPYTIIMDNDFHTIGDQEESEIKEEIIIEDEVWIAMRCMIMKGVTVGKGAVVASGAIVTKDVPPYTVVGGIPAKVLKNIDH